MTYGQQPGHGRSGLGARGYGPVPGGQGGGPVPAIQGRSPGYAGQRHGQGGYGHPGGQVYGAPPQYAQPYGAPPAPYDAAQYYAPPVPAYTAPPAATPRRAPAPAGGPVTDEDERWAVPAYVGMFVSGFIAPAIVYVIKGRSSPFARFHAVQALNLFIAMTVCNLVAYGLMYVIGLTGLLVALAAVAVEFFFIVKAAIGANRCEWYRLPSIVAWPILR